MRAKNIYGWGNYSNNVTIKAAGVPSQVDIPTVTYGSGTNVNISFTEPLNNGDPITNYTIQIKGKNGTLY